MRNMVKGIVLVAAIAWWLPAGADTTNRYGYRPYAGDTRNLFTRTHEINVQQYRGEISRGEAAFEKFRARTYQLDSASRARSQPLPEASQPRIPGQSYLQQPVESAFRAPGTVESTLRSTSQPVVAVTETGFLLSQSQRDGGKTCYYNVLRGVKAYDTDPASPCPSTIQFTQP